MTQENPHDQDIAYLPFLEQGDAAWKRSDYREAQVCYERALEQLEHELGPEHPDSAPILTSLGEILQTQGQYSQAEGYYQRALTLCERSYGRVHPHTMQALGDVAGICEEQGRLEQAKALYEESLQLTEQIQGSFHLDTALALSKVARFYRVVGDYEQAEALFERARSIYEQYADNTQKATMLNNYAFLKNAQGLYAAVGPLLRKAIQINTTFREKDHLTLGGNLKNLAIAFSGQNEAVIAEALQRQAFLLYERTLGTEHPDTIRMGKLLLSYDEKDTERT